MASQINFFDLLPKEVGLQIFSDLDEESLHQVSFVSKRCLAWANEDCLWKRSLIQRSMEPVAACKKELIRFFEVFIKSSLFLFHFSIPLDKSPKDIFEQKKQTIACIKQNGVEKCVNTYLNSFLVRDQINTEIIYTLIELGAKPTTETLNCRDFDLKIFQILINAGAKPNDDTLTTVLRRQTRKEEILPIIQLFLSAKVSLTDRVLSCALANNNSPEVIRALLDAKAPGGDKALENALSLRYPARVIKWLLDVNPKVSNETLRLALSDADKEVLELVLDAKIEPTVKELELAVKQKRAVRFVQKLLNYGLKPTRPMLETAIDGDNYISTNVLQLLIRAGAQVDKELVERAFCCWGECRQIIPILLQAGATVSNHALKLACQRGNSEIFEMLVKKAWAPSSEVMCAAIKAELEPGQFKMLLDINPDLSEDVMLAAVTQPNFSPQIIRMLIDAGAEVTERVREEAAKRENEPNIMEPLRKKRKTEKQP